MRKAYVRVASLPFSDKSYSAIVVLTVFWDFTQHFLRNALSESSEISRAGLPIPHRQINYETFVKNFQSNYLQRLEILMMNLTSKYSKNNNFLRYFLFFRHRNTVFHNFQCFPFYAQFLWFFCFLYHGKFATLTYIHKVACMDYNQRWQLCQSVIRGTVEGTHSIIEILWYKIIL